MQWDDEETTHSLPVPFQLVSPPPYCRIDCLTIAMIATTAFTSNAGHCCRLSLLATAVPVRMMPRPEALSSWPVCRFPNPSPERVAPVGQPYFHTLAAPSTRSPPSSPLMRSMVSPTSCLLMIQSPVQCPSRTGPVHSHSCRAYSSSNAETDEKDRQRDRQINMGRAVHVLRNDLDHFCASGLVTTDIYSPDMRFYDPHSRLHLSSLRQYLLASKALRVLLHMYYIEPQLSLTRLVQLRHPELQDTNLLAERDDPLDPLPAGGDSTPALPRDVRDDEDGALRATFLLTGLPRHRYFMRLLTPAQPLSDADVDQIEGVAMYTFNREGKVHAHWIERLIPRPNLLRYLGGASQWWRGGPKGPGSVDEWRAGWCCEEVKVPGPVRQPKHHGKA